MFCLFRERTTIKLVAAAEVAFFENVMGFLAVATEVGRFVQANCPEFFGNIGLTILPLKP